ncbi:MAG: RNA polymerase sporulation sigma factor SigG [Clostridia bacterium]|nr:RNA polymerase sporulation sigma factor SigG [Clostridia bacterium]
MGAAQKLEDFFADARPNKGKRKRSYFFTEKAVGRATFGAVEKGEKPLQHTKVEICGVNTTTLRVLSAAQTEELLRRIAQGDRTARQEFIEGNLRLVLSVIQRFIGRGEMVDDLFQVGCIGLIKAVDHFDLRYQVKFSTYAVPMIVGELRRHMRDFSAVRVSRSLRDTAYKALTVRERLTAELSREPHVEEVAKELGLKKEEVVMALDAILDPISLFDPVYSDGGDTVCVMDQVADPFDLEENWVEELSIRESIQSLSKREKRILALRFFEGRTQMEVAKEIQISQAQVSRLEKGAIERIKKNL